MLGIILNPLGQEVPGQPAADINYTGAGNDYLCPPDPQYNTGGEQGFFYDTPLGGLGDGGIPTDTELASVYGYTPVAGGWVNGQFNNQNGYWPSPWRVPGGWNPAGAYGPQPNLSGLRDSCASQCGGTPMENMGCPQSTGGGYDAGCVSSWMRDCLNNCPSANVSTGGSAPVSSLSSSTPTWLVLLVIAGLGVAGWWGYREFKKPVRAHAA